MNDSLRQNEYRRCSLSPGFFVFWLNDLGRCAALEWWRAIMLKPTVFDGIVDGTTIPGDGLAMVQVIVE